MGKKLPFVTRWDAIATAAIVTPLLALALWYLYIAIYWPDM